MDAKSQRVVRIDENVWRSLSTLGKAVYGTLILHFAYPQKEIPSIQELSEECGMTRNTFVKGLREVESKGLVRRIDRIGDRGDIQPPVYHLQGYPSERFLFRSDKNEWQNRVAES